MSAISAARPDEPRPHGRSLVVVPSRLGRGERDPADAAHHDISVPAMRLGMAVALLLGTVLRIRALAADFPLNDGGLFYTMTRDLQAAHYRLPVATTYNNAHIPFAYPPLGFYLAGLLDAATPMSLLTVYRVIPFAFSLLIVGAFVWLAAALLSSRRALLAAAIVYVIFPLSYRWMIMGGSVARAPALFCALIALRMSIDMYRSGRLDRRVAVVGALFALTALSHLETAFFLALSLALFAVAFGQSRAAFAQLVSCGVLAIALSAPWWGIVVAHHGADPFLAAGGTGEWSVHAPVAALLQLPKAEPLFPVVTALAVLGTLAAIAERRLLFPAWLLLGAVLDPRAFPTFASIPLAMLAGVAICDVLIPIGSRALPLASFGRASDTDDPRSPYGWLTPAAVAIGIVVASISSLVSFAPVLTSMTPGEREAMQWVRANTPADARVLVISGDDWTVDRTSEWFPTLTGRTSVATVQGYEWVGGAFQQRQTNARALRKCAIRDIACLDAWAAASGVTYDYVFITKMPPREESAFAQNDCCLALRADVRRDLRFTTVYEGDGAAIARFDAGAAH